LITNTINLKQTKKEICDPFGLDETQIMSVIPHFKPGAKKTPVKEMKEFLSEEFIEVSKEFGFRYLIVTNADYYKVVTGMQKAEADLGYVRPVFWDAAVYAVYMPSLAQIFHDPEKVRAKIRIAIEAVIAHQKGEYEAPGDAVIKTAYYPKT